MINDFITKKIGHDSITLKNFDINAITILIIDDCDEIREYIAKNLIRYYQIIEAQDGEEGIRKTLQCIPDLIICDVMMPKKNGFEVCKILKDDIRTSHIPIILLTAKTSSEDKLEGLQCAADDYIIKPFASQELIVRVKNLINLRKMLIEKYADKHFNRISYNDCSVKEQEFINKVISIIERSLDDVDFSAQKLAKLLTMSHSQLYRKLKAIINQSTSYFINSVRMNKAAEFMHKKQYNISEVAFKVGFEDPNYFSKVFKKYYKKSPTEFINDIRN